MSDTPDSPTNGKLKLLRAQVKRAKSIAPELLECRVGGTRHRWVRCQPHRTPPPGQRITVHQCDNCDGIRTTLFGARYGEIISRSYLLPKGYSLTREANMVGALLSAAAVRLTLAEVPWELPEVRWFPDEATDE